MSSATLNRAVLRAMVVAVLVLSGCAADAPEVPVGPDGTPDPVLVLGRDVFARRCSSCHGSSGDGGTGPRLAGSVVDGFPEIDDQIAVVADGRKSMPSFGGSLTDAEIEAVVRYTREVLS